MTNPYYTASGKPTTLSRGTSSDMRGEFQSIQSAFDLVNTALAALAPTLSPAFTGIPTAPTAAPGTNTTQLATCAFVLAQSYSVTGAEASVNKDASGGYVGLTGYSHNFKNAAGTFTSYLTNANTASRTYTFPDYSGTVAMISDIASNSTPSFRNRIINGDMRIDQRNAGAAQTFTAGAALAYSVDRWYGYCTGANVTGQRIAGSGQTQYRYQFTGAASVTGIGYGQRIESQSSFDLNGKTATISVDLANSLLTSVTWTAYYANTADTFGTLASPTRTQIATGTFTVNSTVSRYSAQISIPAAATTGIEIVFSVGAQISGTWTIGNVQLESGSSATPFEQRPIGAEAALAQRYFQSYVGAVNTFQLNSYGAAAQQPLLAFTIPAMRAVPTAAQVGTFTYSNAFGLNVSANAVNTFITYVTVTATGAFYVYNNANSGFTFSAEL